ncbi:hypothetical protein N7448_001020 [Penicillium atrosanguineum]|nr:hypothetical protein N7448_001020 [Penicillium atrosanguineum]
MERVRKTFFDPLASSKARIREILEDLPVGSAHPFSPERLLLCRTDNGIDEIDISSYPEDYFFNAVDLGEMGETLLRRMAGFKSHLRVFEDFQIMQAPASTFKIPIVSDQITILAVSERTPTYYDFCFADASYNACCWLARDTFPGITHSGDILNGQDLLDYVKINMDTLTEEEICVFISGYQSTLITRFLGTNPALLVADHVDKVLYIVPVPLDAATIGDATICCPLVIKRDEGSLICSILPKATTDRGMMCHSNKLVSACFPEAIQRADFTISAPLIATRKAITLSDSANEETSSNSEILCQITKENALFTTDSATLPSFFDLENTQIIRFGTGLEFELPDKKLIPKTQPSAVVLPCIFGSQLQGPVLLATGTCPTNVPFIDDNAIQNYYKQLKSAVVIVDDRMTDNARNLASIYRINALFIVQLSPENQPKNTDEILALMNSVNINAVTALAGPQSLVLIQIADKYYFYRGLANRAHINTSRIKFGADVTSILESVGVESILDPRIERMATLGDANPIILPSSGQFVQPKHLKKLFEDLSVDQVQDLEEDISAAVPQLQMILNQKDLQDLSKVLVSALSIKISTVAAPLRNSYTKFLTQEYNAADPDSAKKKNDMLGRLRKITKEMQVALEPLISSLANMISSQTTSKRTHDLKRLVRQTQIQGNVEAVKSMTFDTLAGYLETYAGDMGVMLLNIKTTSYRGLLRNLKSQAIDASPCCDLDSRVLHLEGFDAGIIIEQSQTHHDGPLQSQVGPSHPILALPYLSQGSGTGSMLAWVCWDEFVNLKSPYTVRWMEKCNEPHIAALRIIMRSTLSQAVASREHEIQSSSPETGHLMSALLMAAMGKLAAMRTTTPVVSEEAEDTVTRLMRGLFGNLLTIAGSGVRPLSMVWQLFGLNPQYDLPTTDVGWIWYETVVSLYPYTGWPLKQFYNNLEKLLDKAIVRVVTKNEDMTAVKSSRADEMVKFCKLRNIQLDHSRTIITAFMRMLTMENTNIAAVAARLLGELPHKLEKQSGGYTKMIMYLEHLANGGERRVHDDTIAANIYTTRSATFSELKAKVSEACQNNEWADVKHFCEDIVYKQADIASLWHIKPASLKVQSMRVYNDLLNADFGDNIDETTKTNNLELTRRVLGDAETRRVPWQVGKEGQYGDLIEPLDEAFLHEILTGEKSTPLAAVDSDEKPRTETTAMSKSITEDQFAQFSSSLQSSFITTMQRKLSAEDVCTIINVPVTAMRVFIKALNPEFVWEDLGENFKETILGLLNNRSNRAESRPTKKLLALEIDEGTLQIEG